MKLGACALAGVAVALLGSASVAAQTASPKKDGVNDYLCTFAGKCGDATPEATPTMAAPATKGFRLAAPQASPTVAAPATKGFRLAAPPQAQPSPQPTSSAPLTRGFRLATAPTAKPAAAAPAAKPAHARHMASTAMAPVAGKTHANLQLAFELNSDQLTPGAQERAKTFAQALMSPELKDKRFLIEGHTDSRGSRDANIDLSRRRAQAVADFLAKQGVDSSRVEVKGVGPDEPLPGHAASAEANRRVEAVLIS